MAIKFSLRNSLRSSWPGLTPYDPAWHPAWPSMLTLTWHDVCLTKISQKKVIRCSVDSCISARKCHVINSMYSDSKRISRFPPGWMFSQSQTSWHLIFSRNAPVVWIYVFTFSWLMGRSLLKNTLHIFMDYHLVFLCTCFSIIMMWWQFYHFITTSVFWSLFSDSLLWPDCTECSRGWLCPLATVNRMTLLTHQLPPV